jgi:ankyrin repeat protein
VTQTAPNSASLEELLPDSHQNAPVHHAGTAGNNEIVELQNSLRSFRLSADGLSLLLERTRADLDVSEARVTTREENIAREANARLFAERNSVDLNSLLLISDFNLKVVKDNYKTTSLRNAELISQGEERASEIRLLRQDLYISKAEMLEHTNMLKEKLAQFESKYKEDIAKTKRECDQLLQSQREKIVVYVENFKKSKIEILKWKTAYEEEHNRFESLEQTFNTNNLKGTNQNI